jgi:hypothetical protein
VNDIAQLLFSSSVFIGALSIGVRVAMPKAADAAQRIAEAYRARAAAELATAEAERASAEASRAAAEASKADGEAKKITAATVDGFVERMHQELAKERAHRERSEAAVRRLEEEVVQMKVILDRCMNELKITIAQRDALREENIELENKIRTGVAGAKERALPKPTRPTHVDDTGSHRIPDLSKKEK